MKVALLFFLVVSSSVAYSTKGEIGNSNRRPSTSGRPSVSTDKWATKQKELINRLTQALDAAKKSNNADVKKKANTLSGTALLLINEMKSAKEIGTYEEQVNTLIEQLKPITRVPLEPGRDYSVQKTELTKRVDHLVSSARSAIEETDRSDLKARLRVLRSESTRLKQTISAIASSAELDQVNRDVKELEGESGDIVNEASSWGITASSILGLLGTVLGLISITLFAITFIDVRGRLREFDNGYRKNQKSLQQLTNNFSQVKQLVDLAAENNSRVQTDLSVQIESARRISEDAKRMASQDKYSTIPDNNISEQVVSRVETRDFPSLVSDYLNSVAESLKKAVENDFTTNTLVQTSAQAAPFMLVAEHDAIDGVVLPKPRLQRGQDFSQFYKSYYACAEPSAGDVYIIRPARVERVGNRWRLQEMGKMEIH